MIGTREQELEKELYIYTHAFMELREAIPRSERIKPEEINIRNVAQIAKRIIEAQIEEIKRLNIELDDAYESNDT